MKRLLLVMCLMLSHAAHSAEVTLEWGTIGITVPGAGQVTDITVDAILGGEYIELHGVANVRDALLPLAVDGTGFFTDRVDAAVLTLNIIENVYSLRLIIDLRSLSGTVDLVHQTFGITGSGRATLREVRCGEADQALCDALTP